MKKPEECTDLGEIRKEIDDIDQQVITLLGQRFAYVKAASKFKISETSVKAPERFRNMLLARRAWAEAAGLNPDVIEKMYQDLVNHFIEEEVKYWKQLPTHT
jgi:isochorismate pyruvate lyase